MAVATLANEHAVEDLKLLLFTLELWNPVPPAVYIYTDSKTAGKIEAIGYKGQMFIQKDALNAYTGMNRSQMELMKGKIFSTVFADFCSEKTRLMAWALAEEQHASRFGAYFCDADICHLGPLPRVNDTIRLALSPHMIRERDSALYGFYNAGYLYMRDVETTEKWLELCATSRFFEQGCLEDLRSWAITKWPAGFMAFPKQVNYGWWRLWQGDLTADVLQAEWRIGRKEGFCGITVAGESLQSIHTHWNDQKDPSVYRFNQWILSQLRKLTSVKKTKTLISFLEHQHRFLNVA